MAGKTPIPGGFDSLFTTAVILINAKDLCTYVCSAKPYALHRTTGWVAHSSRLLA
jgi:hypothetical protein